MLVSKINPRKSKFKHLMAEICELNEARLAHTYSIGHPGVQIFCVLQTESLLVITGH